MSIYAERSRAGKLTGAFRIEVQLQGSRLRGKAKSHSEAKRIEADLLGRLKDAPQSTYQPRHAITETIKCLTLGEGRDRANGLLWAGQSTEYHSLRKLSRVVEIVGADTLLDDFDANALDRVMVELKTGGASDATVNRYLSNISAFLKFCFKRGMRTQPVPTLDWKDEDEGRIRWLSYDEEAALQELMPEPIATVVYIAVRTGMRAMEILSLTPDQVSPRWVHLWGTGTKTGSSRSVPLSPDLYELLEPLVSAGALPSYPRLRYEWDKAREAMGLKDDPSFVFHSTRHTFATRAVQAGVNIRVIQKLMGHKTIQTTLRYAHVDDSTLSEASLMALDFHDKRQLRAGDAGDESRGGASVAALPAPMGAINNRRNAPFAKRSVPVGRTANPRTPVRFRLGPPFHSVTYSNDD